MLGCLNNQCIKLFTALNTGKSLKDEYKIVQISEKWLKQEKNLELENFKIRLEILLEFHIFITWTIWEI